MKPLTPEEQLKKEILSKKIIHQSTWDTLNTEQKLAMVTEFGTLVDYVLARTIPKEKVKDIELWFLRLHNEPEQWTVEQALFALGLDKEGE